MSAHNRGADSVWAEGLELLNADPEAYFSATPPPFRPTMPEPTARFSDPDPTKKLEP